MDWEYTELEAARFFHYTLSAWQDEPVEIRARVIAHYLEHGMREEYIAEKLAPKETPAPGAPPGWATEDRTKFSQRPKL